MKKNKLYRKNNCTAVHNQIMLKQSSEPITKISYKVYVNNLSHSINTVLLLQVYSS